MNVSVHPLVPNAVLPSGAPAATRLHVPSGYGVQEQCLPFTAAAAAGLLIHAPFGFGFCRPEELPAGVRAFTSPRRDPSREISRVFYVRDEPASRFERNAFRLYPIPFRDAEGRLREHSAVQPGLSFFDRLDQADLFKLHLPYVLRTPGAIDSLFTAPINRPGPLPVVSGLVETEWYAHPVNLVLRCPEERSVHVAAGDVVAQVVFVPRQARDARLRVVAFDSAEGRAQQDDLLRWYAQHAADRSAYKKLARSRHGRIELDPGRTPSPD